MSIIAQDSLVPQPHTWERSVIAQLKTLDCSNWNLAYLQIVR